jgi:type I restriction enzyme S subunit
MTKIRAFSILKPTKVEQGVIAEALSDADALIESLEQLIAKKRHLKQGAIQELLTGKKRLPGFREEWETKRIADIADVDCESIGSGTPETYRFKYISLEDVDYGVLRGYSEQTFRSAPSRARRRTRQHDILVATVRPNLKSHLLFREQGEDWVCSTGFAVVRCRNHQAAPGYLFAHMFGWVVEKQIERIITGSNYPAINGTDVKALEVSMPHFDEQTAIAAILSDMDAEIAALEAKLSKARQIKQGMMQELLTGRVRLIDN